jgi:predicted nucleotide-binding protein
MSFLASSNEGRPIAEALQPELAHDCVPQGWWSLFGNKPGATNLEQLLDLPHFDFASMLLTRDDRIWHRKREFDVPRDNLIFELGLFMGAMGGRSGRCLIEYHLSPERAI